MGSQDTDVDRIVGAIDALSERMEELIKVFNNWRDGKSHAEHMGEIVDALKSIDARLEDIGERAEHIAENLED